MKKNMNEVTFDSAASKIKRAIIHIVGDSDLILNKMNARNTRILISPDRKAIREQPNLWEDLITAIHWKKPLPMKDTYKESDEAMMHKLLLENAPCITAFGLKKCFADAIVHTGIENKKTAINANLNIDGDGLIPVKAAAWEYKEKLMSPHRGSPITVALNYFHGWEAEFTIAYMDGVYSRDKLVEVIDTSGFSNGIGSGRSSGYGRFHVDTVTIPQMNLSK